MQLAAAPNLGDYIPCIAPLDLPGFTKRMKAVNKVFDDFFEKIIEEHLQSRDDLDPLLNVICFVSYFHVVISLWTIIVLMFYF
jgi:hypothetical protein